MVNSFKCNSCPSFQSLQEITKQFFVYQAIKHVDSSQDIQRLIGKYFYKYSQIYTYIHGFDLRSDITLFTSILNTSLFETNKTQNLPSVIISSMTK